MIRCNINFNPFATTIIVALHEMLRIVRYDPTYRMSFSNVFIINFFFFCSINTSFFQSNLEFLEHRAHFSCGVARSERIKDKTRSQGLTYVLRVSRISFGYPQSRFSNRLYMERGGDWRVAVEKIPWQERAAFAPHGVRSLCFASCP